MDIRGLLQFEGAQIESMTITPAEKDPTCSLVLSAAFSPKIAEIMRCRDSFYDKDEKPYHGPTRIDLGEKKLRDVDVSLPSADVEGQLDTYRPEQINGFRIDRASEDNPTLRLHLRVRIQGRYEELAAFLRKQNKDPFEFAIRSLQDEFDWSGSTKGSPVDMPGDPAGKSEVNGPLFQQPECIHCNNEVPVNEDGKHFVNDSLILCPGVSSFSPSNEGAKREVEPVSLPRAATMGAGRTKQRERRRPTADEVDANNGVNEPELVN